MENKEQQILSEIKSMMASIRVQLERLDAKMAELQQAVDPEEFEADSIDLEIEETVAAGQTAGELVPETVEDIPLEDLPSDDLPFVDEEPAEEPVAETAEETMTELAEETVTEPAEEPVSEQVEEPEQVPETVSEPEPEQLAEPEAAPELEQEFEPEPVDESEPEPVTEPVPDLVAEPVAVTLAEKAESAARPTVNDAMAAQQAWRKDMPGSQVKDIRSAISLNDRVLFINGLFREDPMTFQESLTKINQMASLDDVVAYLRNDFPEWDMNSEIVYRFMMAVRRKVR